MTDAKVQEGETENPFSFFRTPWFKDAILQLCADGWPTFIVPLNIKINQCEEAYEALKIENESLKLQVKLLSEKTFNDVQELQKENAKLRDKLKWIEPSEDMSLENLVKYYSDHCDMFHEENIKLKEQNVKLTTKLTRQRNSYANRSL